jgi:hypothetical protein
MDVRIDTITEIGSVFLDSLAGPAVCAALEKVLTAWDDRPENRKRFRISVSHAVGPTGVLSIVAIYASGQGT